MEQWIIAITPVYPSTGVLLKSFVGTKHEAKLMLMRYVMEDKVYTGLFQGGTETIDDIIERSDELIAYGFYPDYINVSYTAKRMNDIKSIKLEDNVLC